MSLNIIYVISLNYNDIIKDRTYSLSLYPSMVLYVCRSLNTSIVSMVGSICEGFITKILVQSILICKLNSV